MNKHRLILIILSLGTIVLHDVSAMQNTQETIDQTQEIVIPHPVVEQICLLNNQLNDCVQTGQSLNQAQIKTYYSVMAPYLKKIMAGIKVSAMHAYHGSEWCCRTVMPPLYRSLAFVFKHWIAFIQSGGEFSFDTFTQKKPDEKVTIKETKKVNPALITLDSLYLIEVAHMIVKGEKLSLATRKKTFSILRKTLKYEYGTLEELLVSYFNKVLT